MNTEKTKEEKFEEHMSKIRETSRPKYFEFYLEDYVAKSIIDTGKNTTFEYPTKEYDEQSHKLVISNHMINFLLKGPLRDYFIRNLVNEYDQPQGDKTHNAAEFDRYQELTKLLDQTAKLFNQEINEITQNISSRHGNEKGDMEESEEQERQTEEINIEEECEESADDNEWDTGMSWR